MRLLAFDLDGTLLDTRKDYEAAINWTLPQFGLPTISVETITAALGYGTDHLVKECFRKAGGDPSQLPEFRRIYLGRYLSETDRYTYPYPGIREFLIEAKSRGYRLAVVSNKPDPAAQKLVSNHFGDIGFDAVIGQRKGDIPKPAPDSLIKVFSSLGISPSETCYFGDTEVDSLFANNTSCALFVLCLWGFRSREELEEASVESDIEASSPSELLPLLDGPLAYGG